MVKPNRRDLLGVGAGLGALALHGGALFAKAPVGADEAASGTAPSLRERLNLDRGWRFSLGHAQDPARDFGFGADQSAYAKSGVGNWPQGPASASYQDDLWTPVDLPHDWAVDLPFAKPAFLDPAIKDDPRSYHGFKPLGREFPETSVGWYRRLAPVAPSDRGRRLSLEFEGVFRDCLVMVNGYILCRNESGYDPFRVDFSDVANFSGPNVITVRVDASEGEGWFYEGAGIYRHVWLVKTDPVHVPQWGTAVRTRLDGGQATAAVLTEATNESDAPQTCTIVSTIIDPAGRKVGAAQETLHLGPWSTETLDQTIVLPAPALWSPETPRLYRLDTTILSEGRELDRHQTDFGVRTLAFDPDRGFFLNGQAVKIKGTCNHQDHAGVGVAIPDRLHAFRIERLKAMGSNAYRTAHNPPAPALLDACDRLGMLVLDETRRMSADPESLVQLERMVRRDRNRPSVILWSIGNEEPQQGDDIGARVATTMKRRVEALDGTRLVTEAMNFGWGRGVSGVLDVVGFNYSPKAIAPFHAKFPKTPVICTETASTTTTRGVYQRDPIRQYTTAYDQEAPPWGQTGEQWWPETEANAYIAGGFVWTGFDYRGEPTPFNRWPSVSSSFGLMDSCGFAKDEFFYYKAWWDPAPQVHLLPHWTWPGREGQPIDIWCYANVDRVELYVNGVSLGSKPVVRGFHLSWTAAYAPGAIEAHGFQGERLVIKDRRETAGLPARLFLSSDRTRLKADGADLAVITIAVADDHGRPSPDADCAISLEIIGPAAVLGMGNGNPTSHEPDRTDQRKAFKGLCMGLVQTQSEAGRIQVRATSDGIKSAELILESV